MIIGLTAALLILLLVGLGLIGWLWRSSASSDVLVKILIGIGLGAGVSSLAFFLWLALFSASNIALWLIDVVLLIALLGAIVATGRLSWQAPSDEATRPKPAQRKGIVYALGAIFAVLFILRLIDFATRSINSPHGEWDARAMWNFHARFMFRGGPQWTALLDASPHPDYPLLLPGIIARGWRYAGLETQVIPIVVAAFFTFATVGLLYAALAALRSKGQGLLAGIVLMMTPTLVRWGTAQYADVPLGFFMLATLVLLALQYRRLGQDRGLIALAGVSAGLAAWTKNEGLLFVGVVFVALLIVSGRAAERRMHLRNIAFFSAGLLPVLAVVLFFKTRYAPANDILVGQGFQESVQRIVTVSRYGLVSKALVNEFVKLGSGSSVLLVFYLVLAGTGVDTQSRSGVGVVAGAVILMLVGIYLVYIVTSINLAWQLSRSMDRLLLQIWPGIIFAILMIVPTPERALFPDRNRMVAETSQVSAKTI